MYPNRTTLTIVRASLVGAALAVLLMCAHDRGKHSAADKQPRTPHGSHQ